MLSSIVLANSTSRGPPTRWEAFSIIALTRSRMRLVIGLAFGAAQEAAQAARLTQRRELGVTPGEDLPRIALVPHVPDDAVVGGIEDVQQRDRQLDNAEPRADVTPGLRDHVDQPLPH